jgi:SPOR domain
MADVKQQTTKTTNSEKKASDDASSFASCEECGAPLDEKQRYCVSCGARRRDKGGPAVQYFASAGKRGRRGGTRTGGPSGARAAAVLFFVVLPIAVAIGVLVGKGNGNDNQDIADAIKHLQAGGTGSQLASTAASTPITSDWTLDKGYTVELKTLPQSSDQAAVDAAKKAATSQGAADVGVINPADFAVTPAPQGGGYVLYSGQFKTKAEATKAIAKLKPKFLGALVVAVKRNAGGDQGQLVGKTAYGDVHKVENFTPSAQKVASDTAIVNSQAQKTGKDYVDSQKDLPDVIVVGGSGGGPSSPAGQGNGD